MKRRIRVAAASSLLALAALGLIACGGGDDETTTSVVTETVTVAQKPCGMYTRWTLVVQGDVPCAEARRVFRAHVNVKPLPSDWNCSGPEGGVVCHKLPDLLIVATCCGGSLTQALETARLSE
jgi:hypothetical protein